MLDNYSNKNITIKGEVEQVQQIKTVTIKGEVRQLQQ